MTNPHTTLDPPTRLLIATGRLVDGTVEYLLPLVAGLRDDDLSRFLQLTAYHRVTPQVAASLGRLQEQVPGTSRVVDLILRSLAGPLQKMSKRRTLHESAVQALMDDMPAGPVVGIKGVHLAKLYKSSSREFSGDVDLLIPADQLITIVGHALDQGYRVPRIRYGRYMRYRGDRRYPPFYGVCEAAKIVDGESVLLDFHFGAFPACGEGLVLVTEEDVTPNGSTFFPTLEKAAVILLAHTMRQGFCRLRDVNDLWSILSSPAVDRPRIAREAKELGLLPLLRGMTRLVEGCYSEENQRNPGQLAGVRVLDRLLLLEDRIRSPGYTDDVSFVRSRVWQIRYLAQQEIVHRGPVRGAMRALMDTWHLMRTGRPYAVWRRRPVGGIDARERFVLCPVGYLREPVPAESLAAYAERSQLKIDWIETFRFLVLQSGLPDEVVIAQRLVLAQANYAGDHAELTEAHRRVTHLVHEIGVPILMQP